MRSDTAGHQVDLLRYCAEGQNKRFGVIEFAVGVRVEQAMRHSVSTTDEAEWKPLPAHESGHESKQTWAEICHVPNWVGHSKTGPSYRFIAVREPVAEPVLPGMDEHMPFPVVNFSKVGQHKVHVIVTNVEGDGAAIIQWYRNRCGKSEEAHGILKEDLAGGQFPSKNFGANAAWWAISVLALNVNAIMKRRCLGPRWSERRMKGLRFAVIDIAGRIVRTGRWLIVKVAPEAATWFAEVRARIARLITSPPRAAPA